MSSLVRRYTARATPVLHFSSAVSFAALPAPARRTLVTGRPKEFLCIMPDNVNVASLRKKVKELHYQGIKPLIESGKLVAGGAMFDKHPEEGEHPVFAGSAVVYTGESVEEVRDIVQKDIYATSGVWDLEKVQIIPYVPAVRQPI